MEQKRSFGQRWEDATVSKTVAFWSCAACVAGALVVGFTWGGWVTGGSAETMARRAANDARAELAAAVCVHQFNGAPDASGQLALLQKASAWSRSGMIEKGGWSTLAGVAAPVAGAADLCAKRLIDAAPAVAALPPG